MAGILKDSEEVAEHDNAEVIQETVPAPSLAEARQNLKGLTVLFGDNTQFSAQDNMWLNRMHEKVAKMLVSRPYSQQQRNITAYFNAA